MLKHKINTIILDIDETLSEEVSWYKLTKGLGASKKKHELIFERFKNNELSYENAKKRLIKLWQATGNANKDHMEMMFRAWKLRKNAKQIIDYLKQSYRLCLISGSVDLYVQVVSEKLDIENWYANTKLIWNNKGDLIDFHYTVDQAQKKLEQFQEYININRVEKVKCAIIGNGDSDLVLFKELKFGIEVNKTPNPDLKGLAFKTIKDLLQLKDIF